MGDDSDDAIVDDEGNGSGDKDDPPVGEFSGKLDPGWFEDGIGECDSPITNRDLLISQETAIVKPRVITRKVVFHNGKRYMTDNLSMDIQVSKSQVAIILNLPSQKELTGLDMLTPTVVVA